MPIYEYRCDSCGFEDEFLQKVSAPLLTDCPKCGKATFTKLISAAGFQLKGSGWYVTDFRNSGSKPAAGKDAASAEKDSKSAEKESKSAEKDSKSAEKDSKSAEKDSKPAATKENPGETKKEQSVSGT